MKRNNFSEKIQTKGELFPVTFYDLIYWHGKFDSNTSLICLLCHVKFLTFEIYKYLSLTTRKYFTTLFSKSLTFQIIFNYFFNIIDLVILIRSIYFYFICSHDTKTFCYLDVVYLYVSLNIVNSIEGNR